MSEELNEEGQKVTIPKMSSKYRFFVIAGEFPINLIILYPFLAERFVLPLLVLILSLIYTIVSATLFYADTDFHVA